MVAELESETKDTYYSGLQKPREGHDRRDCHLAPAGSQRCVVRCLSPLKQRNSCFRPFRRLHAETFEVANVGYEVKGTCRNGVQQRP